MIYFFLYLSFFVVLLIIYKKLMPFFKAYLADYQKKISNRLEQLEKEHRAYNSELAKLNQDVNRLHLEIDEILKEGEINVLNMKKAYNVVINDILKEKRKVADQHIKNLQERFNQDIRELIATNIKNNLIIWFKNNKSATEIHNKIYAEAVKHIK